MRPTLFVSILLVACCSSAVAQTPKVPIKSGDEGTVYVNPNVSSTETSMETKGAIVGVERPDGRTTYGGVDTSGTRPVYSVGGSTGGTTSFSAGVLSDGKENKGVKAGVTIKY